MKLQTIDNLINLKGKTAIITGGAMGIGAGIVYRLAEAGANIVIADINKEVGKAFINELKDNNWKAEFIKTDVSNEKEVQATVDFAIKTYGSIDILVNNAGIFPIIPIMNMKISEYEKIMDINLKGVFLFTKAVAKVMIKKRKGGKIINITSIDALHPSSVGLAVYDASKHGLWGFTKNVALELASHNIQVNAVAPGGISTPGTIGPGGETSPEMKKVLEMFIQKIPMARMGEPDDIGKTVLFLASDLSSYITGTQIVVDGGRLLS